MFLILTEWIPTVNYDTKLRKIRGWINIGMHGISAQWQLHARYLYIYRKVLIESFFNLKCGSISIDLFPSHIVPHYVLHLHHYAPWFRPLCICLAFPIVVFVLIMYCTLSHMLGHVTSSANSQLYPININKISCETFKTRWHRRFAFDNE